MPKRHMKTECAPNSFAQRDFSRSETFRCRGGSSSMFTRAEHANNELKNAKICLFSSFLLKAIEFHFKNAFQNEVPFQKKKNAFFKGWKIRAPPPSKNKNLQKKIKKKIIPAPRSRSTRPRARARRSCTPPPAAQIGRAPTPAAPAPLPSPACPHRLACTTHWMLRKP